MHNVIVFGSGGLVGSAVIEELKKTPYTVIAPLSKEINLLDNNALAHFVQQPAIAGSDGFSVVVLASAIPYRAVPHDDHDAMFNNIKMAGNIRDAFKATNIAELIYVSTRDVYKDENKPVAESSPVGPVSNYAISKLASEYLLNTFSQKKQIPFCCLRLTNLYGINDDSPKVINKFFDSAFKTAEINISGDKNALRDFMNAEDAARVIADFVNKRVNDTVNVATGKSVTLDFLAKEISKCFNQEIKINYINPAAGGSNSEFDISRLRKYYQDDFEQIQDFIPLLYERKKS